MGDRVRTFVILIVALVWAANFIAPLFVKGYQPSPELNVAFMAIIGFATASFGSGVGNRSRTNGQDPDQESEQTPRRSVERDSSGGVDE